jgi:putative MATE family efflux protein
MHTSPENLKLDTSWQAILKVAVPVSVGVFVQFIVMLIDNIFVAQLDGNAMSAAAFVGLIYVTLVMIGVGVSNAVQILVARRKGEEHVHEVGETVGSAIWLGLAIGVAQFFLMEFAIPPLLNRFIQSSELSSYMTEFIHYRAWGFFVYIPTLIFNAFWSGIARTRVLIYTTAITASFTIVLDYLFIFGKFGAPNMGMAGAAFATVLAEAAAFIFILIYTLRSEESNFYSVKKYFFAPNIKHFGAILKLGGPIALQMVLSLGIWSVFYQFVESMGEQPLQASFIVRTMYMLAYVSVGGFSTTTKTYISGLIAEKRQQELWSVSRKLMLFNFIGIVLLSHGLWLYPEFIAKNFTHDPIVIAQAVDIMHIVLPAMFTFSVTSIMLGMVEGSGNTMAGFFVELLTTIAYICTAYYMVYVAKWPIDLVWTSDYLYFALIGLLSLIFLWNGKWKYNQV